MQHSFHASKHKSLLLVIDIQTNLSPAMENYEAVVRTTKQLTDAAQLLSIPIFITEQYKQGLGETDPRITSDLKKVTPFDKVHFSAYQQIGFDLQLSGSSKAQIIIVGMETHVCVLQTALDLIAAGYQIFIVADGVCSRNDMHRDLALEQLRQAGAIITCAESVIFQWTEVAATSQFKDILKIIK